MAKGHLKYAMLKYLSREPLSGYGIMKRIKDQSIDWHPSFGSIYPHLKSMHQDGYLKARKKGRSILYEITPQGREALIGMDVQNKDVFKELLARMKVFSAADADFDEKAISFWERIQKGDDPFQEVNEEIIRLKKAMFSLATKDVIHKKRKEVAGILQRATKEMERLS